MVLVVRLLESSCLALPELGSLQHAVLGVEVGTAAGSRALTPLLPTGPGQHRGQPVELPAQQGA